MALGKAKVRAKTVVALGMSCLCTVWLLAGRAYPSSPAHRLAGPHGTNPECRQQSSPQTLALYYDSGGSDPGRPRGTISTVSRVLTAEVGSFIGGFSGAVLGGTLSYLAGNYVIDRASYNDPLWALPGAFLGSIIGSSLGTTIVLHRDGKHEPPRKWTFLGASVGATIGTLQPLFDGRIGDHEYPRAMIAGWALAPITGLVAYELAQRNHSRAVHRPPVLGQSRNLGWQGPVPPRRVYLLRITIVF